MEIKIGHSRDIHQLVENRPLILGGVLIEHPKGLLGHSDADCVLHVVAESIIGALGLGDLGKHFPDTSESFKNRSSSYFVVEVQKMMEEAGYLLGNMDITIYAEEPKMSPYVDKMRTNIADLLKVDQNQINVKATRGEGMDAIGEEKAIAAEAVVLIQTKK